MKKEDIQPWDWQRILFGEAPPEFLLEVFIRTFVIYVVLLIIVRLMGKRMGGQLTISEMAVMVTLGAIISPAMQIPQLGILMGMMILVCALIFQRGLNLFEFKSGRFEELSQGTTSLAVKDGIIQLEEMKKAKVSRQQLFAALRNQNIYNLGDVGRVYLEACGIFSVYKNEEPAPGLQIFPPQDQNINSFSQQIVEGSLVCASCGNVVEDTDTSHACQVCDSTTWISATVSIQSQLTK
ncbi:hypothetical protein DYBT9623_00546 [Dyadobacter sp. CECT 9623]|uniref:YetF C-terminal domain-containing protein n=1 Tax=Dyadobacter linearis TaxID=2823330 RepID=A0ABM8UK75_9BACT|nr:YetF domain-containing protein [Dyadobacter sp. CECT 9623]CAG5067819.1 hypothetical protein DYBT9623_00546 [Dyadobacter sp. CECT 9623]